MAQADESRAGLRTPSARLVRPRLSGLDIAVHLWRAKWLMGVVFLPLFCIGMLGALAMPKHYTATSRLLVSPGGEHAYQAPAGSGTAAARVGPEIAALVQSELELIRSPVVAQTALNKVTLARAYPEIARSCDPETCERLGIAAIAESLQAGGASASLVVPAHFKHRSAAMSAEILNAVIEAYLAYRTALFTENMTVSFSDQRLRHEDDLSTVDQEIRAYLLENNLTDLAAERDTLRQLYQSASSALLQTQTKMRQAEAQLANYQRQIQSIAPEQDMYVEDSRQQGLMALKLEREEKLTRYLPDSRAIQELDKRIAQAESDIGSGESPGGLVRRGPNPLYQQVEAAIATLLSEVQALRSQEAELKSQIAAFEVRQRRLVELQPELQEMERRRDVAEQAVRAFAQREAEERARTGTGQRSVDTVRLLERATAPVKGESLKLPLAIVSLLVAGFAALLAGLMQTFTRRGFATPGAVERTLGLPVLAAIQKY